jgi:biopolymer transport protein ExbB
MAVQAAPQTLQSLFDLLWAGGPLMVPIALASVVALGYAVERWVRLAPGRLGSGRASDDVVTAVRTSGVERGLALARAEDTPATRVLAVGLERARAPFVEREKAVEDAASREVRELAANLRPLYLVYLVAPLLGLLGTVWGMIEAFSNIATAEGLGKPELLAGGIYEALTTTAAGLAVAIPALVVHHHLKGRIERFARRLEERLAALEEALAGRGGPRAPRAAPDAHGALHGAIADAGGGEVGVARP